MTQLIYKVGDTYTNIYSIALALRDQTGETITRIYRPVDETTEAQREEMREHAKKAAEYRKAQKK